MTAAESGPYTRRMSQISRSAGMALVFLAIGASLRAEPLPGRESDLVLPSLPYGVPALITSPVDAKKTILTGGQVVRIGTEGSIQWMYSPGYFLGGLSQIAEFPDGTVFATSVQGYFFPYPPGTGRASIVRLDSSGPASPPPSANLSGDGEPLPFPNPIIGVTPGGVAVDPLNDRVYTVHQRLAIDPLLGTAATDVAVNAYDRSLSLLAQRVHIFEFPDSFIQLAGVFVDSAGFIWVAGVEYPPSPLPRRLFVERHHPNLSGPPIVHRLTLDATFGGTIRAALDPRGGLVIGGERSGGNSDYFRRVSSEGFSASFRQPGFAGGPLAVDAEGSLYIAGHEPIGGLPALVKVSSADTHAWGASFITLASDRRIEALWSPSAGTLDVAGTIDIPFPGSDQTFVSRYRQGAGASGRLVAVSDLEQIAGVGTDLTTPVIVEARDAAGMPQGSVAVDFTVAADPPGGQHLISPDTQTNSVTGRAKTGFRVGSVPLEYQLKANCPSCSATDNNVAFQICGKLETALYREDEDKPGKTPYIEDFIGGSKSEFDKIKYSGCALSSFAMLLNIFRTKYGFTYPESTPGTLNTALTPGGFNSTAGLDFTAASELFTGSKVQFSDRLNVSITMSARRVRDAVEKSLSGGDPVLLMLKSPTGRAAHYITAVGRCGSRYVILDPYTVTNMNLYDPDNPPFDLTLKGARIFKRGF